MFNFHKNCLNNFYVVFAFCFSILFLLLGIEKKLNKIRECDAKNWEVQLARDCNTKLIFFSGWSLCMLYIYNTLLFKIETRTHTLHLTKGFLLFFSFQFFFFFFLVLHIHYKNVRHNFCLNIKSMVGCLVQLIDHLHMFFFSVEYVKKKFLQ